MEVVDAPLWMTRVGEYGTSAVGIGGILYFLIQKKLQRARPLPQPTAQVELPYGWLYIGIFIVIIAILSMVLGTWV
jgi:hypothetical protein